MSVKKWSVVLGVLVTLSMLLSACATPQPQVVEKIVTQVVEKQVVQTQVVEKIQTQVVEVEKQVEVVATATPMAEAKVVRINLGSYPDIIDPQKSSFVNEIAHLRMMYEGLTQLDGELNTVPGAAQKWEYNDDATALTFTLQDDLKYSDGSLLNAARYAFSIRRNIDPATAGEYAQITDEILGAPEWRSCGEDAAVCEAAAAAINESIMPMHADGAACNADAPYEDAECNTLQLTFSRPAPYFHTVMSLWVTYPAKEENITEGGDQWWNSSVWHVGNGPWVLQNLEPFVRAHFVPNTNYWGEIAKSEFEYSYIVDSAVAFEAYKNNEFDIIGAAAEDIEVIKTDATLSQELMQFPGACTYAVMFHQLKEPFTDQKVREAFAHAYDREAWVRDVLSGLGSPALTWIPPGFPGFDPDEDRWGFDPEAAKQAIADSSYGSIEALPPIKLTFSDSPRNRTRYEWLAAQWNEVLGVEVSLDPVEATTYTALTKDVATAPLAFILGWCADYPDPQNWLSVYWKTGAFGERIGFSNAEFDAMVDKADVELDPEVRMQLYMDAQRHLVSLAPVAFAWNNQLNYLVKPWVTGIVTTPQDSAFPGATADTQLIDIDMAARAAAQ